MADDDRIEVVQAFLEKAGARTKCEVCNANQWLSAGTLGNESKPLVTSLHISSSKFYPTLGSGMAAYVFVCTNCGNIRLHARSIIDAHTRGGVGHV
jgi:predicted nucleic acid-binding Zn ribbon protein